jgi:hypothetical protein
MSPRHVGAESRAKSAGCQFAVGRYPTEGFALGMSLQRPVRALGGRGIGQRRLDRVFMDDIFVRLGVALLIRDIPPERLEKRIQKLPTHLGFVVPLALVGFAVLLEAVDEGGNGRRRLTHNRQSLFVSVSVPQKNTPFH